MSAAVQNLVSHRNAGAAKGLLQSLVPRAQCFCLYGTDRRCAWSSDGADDYEIDQFVAGLPDEFLDGSDSEGDCLRRTLSSGRTLLVLPVHDGDGRGLGVLVTVFSRNAGKSSWFNPTTLQSILAPGVGMLGELISHSHRLDDLEARLKAAEGELRLVYAVDEKIHGTSRSHAGLAQLVGQSGRFQGIAYSVLLLPAKRIRISATHSSWKSVNRKAVDRYLVEKLFPQIEGRRSPAVFEVAAIEGSQQPSDQGYQAMLTPLFDRRGNMEGAIAQLGRVDGRAFTDSEKRFMSHIGRKVEYVIERSFDAMTGLMNREGFETQLYESGKALTDDGDAHQVIYFDIDNLRLLNDTFDHSAGDQVIVRFAQVIEEGLPKSGVATRLSGDDFAILLTHATVDDALELAEDVRRRCESMRYLEGDRSLQVTSSIGIASFERRGREGDALTAARIACDSAKDHGRDRIEIYDQDNQSIVRRFDNIHIVAQIQQSLDADRFELLAQPIASLAAAGDASRYEVLLRMRDGAGEWISSRSLISAAERYQLMPQVDRWVLSATLRKLSGYAAQIEAAGYLFAVNLSGQTLGDDDILEFITDEVALAGVPWRALCFEVTESAAVSNRSKAQAFIDRLREHGCRFALDDFGAGLSSFAYLKNFDVDTLKIDGSFIRDITENRISESMVAAITEVAKVMNLETVAEYVETPEIRDRLEALGVQYVQGHAVGRPEPLDDILAGLGAKAEAG